MSVEPTISELENALQWSGKTSLGWSNRLPRFRAPGLKQGLRTGSPNKRRSLPG
jgi:hypothetical protein